LNSPHKADRIQIVWRTDSADMFDRAGVTMAKYQISELNIDQPTEDTGG